MNKHYRLITVVTISMLCACGKMNNDNISKVIETDGLVAFWDFQHSDDDAYRSYYDHQVVDRSFPVYLRQIGDPTRYSALSWHYSEPASKLIIDESGPFNHSVRFNQGYIYGEIPRAEFDNTPLDLSGRNPFTMIAWVRFDANRHMVAGIWDEGGWNRYVGRRQAALFAGLFNQKGVIGHISATGAASFPQSDVDGSQYARLRAIDGKAFDNNKWVSIAMSFDPENETVTAYLNGEASKYSVTDPVTEDVMQHATLPQSNPFNYKLPLYSSRSFQIKYNGYDFHNSAIKEHYIWIDLDHDTVNYSQVGSDPGHKYRATVEFFRAEQSLLSDPLIIQDNINIGYINPNTDIQIGDRIVTHLEKLSGEGWQQIGSIIEKEIQEGAPFTFGRALGLDEDGIEHGSEELYVDGVAVFNRVLSSSELNKLSFIE